MNFAGQNVAWVTGESQKVSLFVSCHGSFHESANKKRRRNFNSSDFIETTHAFEGTRAYYRIPSSRIFRLRKPWYAPSRTYSHFFFIHRTIWIPGNYFQTCFYLMNFSIRCISRSILFYRTFFFKLKRSFRAKKKKLWRRKYTVLCKVRHRRKLFCSAENTCCVVNVHTCSSISTTFKITMWTVWLLKICVSTKISVSAKWVPVVFFTKFNVCSIMVIILSRCEEMRHIRIFVLFIRG